MISPRLPSLDSRKSFHSLEENIFRPKLTSGDFVNHADFPQDTKNPSEYITEGGMTLLAGSKIQRTKPKIYFLQLHFKDGMTVICIYKYIDGQIFYGNVIMNPANLRFLQFA